MKLGLCEYKAGDGPLAERINAGYARFEADLSDGIPDISEDVDDAIAHGCEPIVDCRTTVAALADLLYAEGDPEANKYAAVRRFTSRIAEFVSLHPAVKLIEVWGSAEVAVIAQGRGMALDYSLVLQIVHEQLNELLPDCEIWTGGFGANCLPDFIKLALAQYAPHAFDVCNWHPFIATSGTVECDVATCDMRLTNAREILRDNCADQPFAASGFGLATVPGRPPPAYGSFYRVPGGVRGIPEEEAAQWAVPLMDLFNRHEFRCLCFMVRDRQPRWMHDFCGLLRRDGTEKPHVADVAEWGHSHGKAG